MRRASISIFTPSAKSSSARLISADFKPGGKYTDKDLYEVGGVPVVMKALLDGGYLHGDCMTVTGKTIAENLAGREIPDAIRTWSTPSPSRSRRPAASWC